MHFTILVGKVLSSCYPKAQRSRAVANPEHLKKLKEGVETWNEWRESLGYDFTPDLTEADLSGADLRGAALVKADLTKADLGDADLSWANLSGALLIGTGLKGVNLSRADLREANLIGATLSWADLTGTNLRGANLSETDFGAVDLTEANLRETDLRGADLREAQLIRADLGAADLTGTDLRGVSLQEANLIGVKYDTSTIWPEGFTPPEQDPEPAHNPVGQASLPKVLTQTAKAFDQGQTVRWLIAGAITETNGQIEDELNGLSNLRDKIREQQATIEKLSKALEAERSSGVQVKAENEALIKKIETLTDELKGARANTFTKKVLDNAAKGLGSTLGLGVGAGILALASNMDLFIASLSELLELFKTANETLPNPNEPLDI
ncbi:pentapeptide repeat-containing protein [Hwanghaeella grinnelliae]|uniref:pentapeptide repeat-containing protein n=1 Tax=Hwanghaeella grinnelliae TaxID=2500179 RepID=UPI001386B5D2|nr:pentapeptide repeat-containing protein [Hwanghaeella grinnelliae]